MLRKKKSFVGTAFDRKCNPSENALPFPLLNANPNPLPHPASGGILALRFLICFSALTLVGERKKKAPSSALENQGRGHGYWYREEVIQAAWLYWILCYRGAIGERKKKRKHSEQKNFFSPTTYFHSWMLRVAGQLHSDCTHKIKYKKINTSLALFNIQTWMLRSQLRNSWK